MDIFIYTVYAYAYTYALINPYTHIHTHKLIYTYTRVHNRRAMDHTQDAFTFFLSCTHVFFLCTHTYTCVYTYTLINSYTHILIYTTGEHGAYPKRIYAPAWWPYWSIQASSETVCVIPKP